MSGNDDKKGKVGNDDKRKKAARDSEKNKSDNRNLTLRRKKMKLPILLAGSILTSAIVGNVYAQTCGAQPSCAELGYTYTGSTSDCLSPALSAPLTPPILTALKKQMLWPNCKPTSSLPSCLIIPRLRAVTADQHIRQLQTDTL